MVVADFLLKSKYVSKVNRMHMVAGAIVTNRAQFEISLNLVQPLQIHRIFLCSKMAVIRSLEFVILDGLYRYAKFRQNQCSNFDNVQFFISSIESGWKMPVHAIKLRFRWILGFNTINWESISMKPPKTLYDDRSLESVDQCDLCR